MRTLICIIAVALCTSSAWLNAKRNAKTWEVCNQNECLFKDPSEVIPRLLTPIQMYNMYQSLNNPNLMDQTPIGDVPDDYDPRSNACYHPIRDQGHCGSCWAHACAETLSDRYCLRKNIEVILAPQDLVSCDTVMNKGCNGGNPLAAWEYTFFSGIVPEECFPYTSGTTNVTGDCLISSKACVDKSKTFHKYKSTQPKSLGQNNFEAIQNALMTGPVMATMYVYDDFLSYKSGIYIRTGGSNFLGGHAVKAVGWGHDKKTSIDYWIIANSWGPNWGENGYFRIKMGEVLVDSADTYADPGNH